MEKINRRKFLGLSALAGAGALVTPQTAMASVNEDDTDAKKKKIAIRKLGNTGIEIPILSMGV
ncbi:MAG: twin-arginine translocation signal domain-containing protein, partial [Dysgonamonadaceae bacterium]|nr:twin-arginine translocation signal domain-containing protein [Dysgonamonadaceae bacterium]